MVFLDELGRLLYLLEVCHLMAEFVLGAAAGVVFMALTSSPFFLGLGGKLKRLESQGAVLAGQIAAVAAKVGADISKL